MSDIDIDNIIDNATNSGPVSHQPEALKDKASVSNLYLLGGAGIKICNDVSITDEFKPYYIDTSSSEDMLIPPGVEKILIKPEEEGSGGVRRTNLELLQRTIPDIVDSGSPTPINYVVFSASGATGSVSSYILIEELLKRDLSVVAIVSVKADNAVRRSNTLNTLLSLHNLARDMGKTIPIFLNTTENIVEQDNLSRQFLKTAYAMLADTVIGVDDADRKNFLSPNKATDTSAIITSIVAWFKKEDEDVELEDVISSLVLNNAEDPLDDGVEPIISYNGYFTPSVLSELETILGSEPKVAGLYTLKLPIYVYIAKLTSKVNNDKATSRMMENRSSSLTNLKGSGIVL